MFRNFCLGILVFIFLVFIFCAAAFAEELTILFTGNTHSMLYPCNCPKEPDGGIARRATLVKELKAKYPDLLLLDSGGFFAGGLADQYTQNTQIDLERSRVNLKAMEMMGYDAVSVADPEFNFGRAALEESIARTKFPFISANIESDKILPFILKKTGSRKVGITALTAMSSMQKAGGLKFIAPKPALKKAVAELKKKGAEVIILLSNLAEAEEADLLKDNPEIDVLISTLRGKPEPSEKIGPVLVLSPAWQARRLGKATLNLQGNKIVSSKAEKLRLSDQVAEDEEILKVLPRCFSDANCLKDGMAGSCQNPGTINAACQYVKANKVSLSVITPQTCKVCNTERTIGILKKVYPGLEVSYLYYPGDKAQDFIHNFGITYLPAYFLGKEADKENAFADFKQNLELKGDYYMLKPQIAGIAYFLSRQKIDQKLDLFASLYGKDTAVLLERLKEFNPEVHFLVIEKEKGFVADNGPAEIEEGLRSACVEKYLPGMFYNYISCRARNIESAWWDDCLEGADGAAIKNCAKSQEGPDLLRANVSLNRELEIANGPTYLINNQEIFGSLNVPSKEELRKMLTDQ
jgi:5'-nucleotidase